VEKTALILEDSQTQAQIIRKMIEAAGWTTVHCVDIRSATDLFKVMSIQAMFLDVFVGSYNVLLHVDRFRKLAPDIPLAVMTAGSRQEAIEDTLRSARKTGADYVLRKPFTEAILADILGSMAIDVDSGHKRRHVLIIDDSPTIRSVVASYFDASASRVSTAASMEEAFSNIDIAHVDIALCDVFMPGMGGFQGMRTIRKTWPRVNIIAMSAGLEAKVSEVEALDAARRIGAIAQIRKPFTADAVHEVIASLYSETAPADELFL
jgi:CheY-like chemotaxis protein